jgi:hypothetical protein
VHYLSLPDEGRPLESAQVCTLVSDDEIARILKKERAWPVDIDDISQDGKRLLLNIQYEESNDLERKFYTRRPFIYDLETKTLTMVEPDDPDRVEKAPESPNAGEQDETDEEAADSHGANRVREEES